MDAGRQVRSPREPSSGAPKATACCAAATRSATTGRACRTSPARSTTTRGSRFRRIAITRIGNLGHARAPCFFRNPASLGPPSDLPTARDLPDDRRRHRRHHDVRSEPSGAVRADVDGGLAAEAHERSGRRSALRRHAFASQLADLRLQRGQHLRERLPRRVPAARRPTCRRTSRSGGCIGGSTAACQNDFAFTGAPGTAPLPIFLAYFSGRGRVTPCNIPASYTGANCTSATFRDPLAIFNPDPFDAATALDADLARRQYALNAGLAGRTSSSRTRTISAAPRSSATAATRSTTRCSSSCASGCRTASSSTPTTCSAGRTARTATRFARPREEPADRHRRRRGPRAQSELDLRAAIRPGPALPLRARGRGSNASSAAGRSTASRASRAVVW